MRIRSVESYRITLPFRVSFGHSLKSRDLSQNLIVRVILEDGSTGWGEGVPRDYVTGENIEVSERTLLSTFVPAVIGMDCHDLAAVERCITESFDFLGLDKKSMGAAWCALELALFDAYARAFKLPLSSYFKPQRKEVRFGGTVPFASGRKLAALLNFYKLWGFKTVKLKVGKDPESDLEAVALARRIMGPEAILRVDANCAWTLDEARRAAQSFRNFKVVSYEQPLKQDDWEGLAALTREIPEVVMVDESLCTVAQAEEIAREKVASGFNIRLSKAGGLLPSRRMAELARRHGLAIQMGAQVGESGILSAAGRFFALWQDPFENYEGSANFFLLKKDLTTENLNVAPGGLAGLSFARNKNGLGVTIPEKRLLELTDDRMPEAAKSQTTTSI